MHEVFPSETTTGKVIPCANIFLAFRLRDRSRASVIRGRLIAVPENVKLSALRCHNMGLKATCIDATALLQDVYAMQLSSSDFGELEANGDCLEVWFR